MDRPECRTSELTPVRIRGKNPSDRSHKRNLNEDASATEPSRLRGRPPKRLSTAVVPSPSHSTASSSVSGSTKRRRRGAKTPREVVLSPLESLPVELLQSIFLYSLNLALPQCSPRLGSALSSKHVKKDLVTRAFCVCRATRGSARDSISDIDEKDTELTEQYRSLQSGLLRLKWMTSGLFKECIDTFLVRIAAREFGAVLTKYGPKEPLPTMENYYELLESADDWDDTGSICDSHTLVKELRDGRLLRLYMSRSEIGFNIRTVGPLANGTPPDVDPWPSDEFSMSHYCIRSSLPSRLLHGPWSEEKCEFLELLLEGNFSVDWLYSTNGEIADKGLDDAIREGNLRALGILVVTVKSPGFEREVGERREGDGEFEYGTTVQEVDGHDYVHLWRKFFWHVGVLPRTSHLRLAVIECDCPPDIVYHLLGADTSHIDLEDRELVGWAVEKRKQGDWRGKWLLKLLRKALVWIDPRHSYTQSKVEEVEHPWNMVA